MKIKLKFRELLNGLQITTLIVFVVVTQLLFSTGASYGQNINGKYLIKDSRRFWPTTRLLTFDDGKVTDVTTIVESPHIGRGRYTISNDKLILTYEKIENPDTSYYQIKPKNSQSEWGTVFLTVQDKQGRPMAAYISLLSKIKKPIFSVTLDALDKFHIPQGLKSEDFYISVCWVGYECLDIPIENLLIKNSEILVTLSKNKNYSFIAPKEDVYSYRLLTSGNSC